MRVVVTCGVHQHGRSHFVVTFEAAPDGQRRPILTSLLLPSRRIDAEVGEVEVGLTGLAEVTELGGGDREGAGGVAHCGLS